MTQHRGQSGIHSFRSGVKQNEASSMIHGNVTIDQFETEHVVGYTRNPSLTIGSLEGIHGGLVSFHGHGQVRECHRFPVQNSYSTRFLLTRQSKIRILQQIRFALHNSILDVVQEQSHDLQRSLNQRDKNKLDEYFTSVRDVERRNHYVDGAGLMFQNQKQ